MKKMLVTSTGIILLFLLVLIWIDSPTMYIYRRTGFMCWMFPKLNYTFNVFDHGKDFDAIHIFTLKEIDSRRFSDYVHQDEDWNPLPIHEDLLASKICNIDFDQHMQDFVYLQEGFWYMDQSKHKLYIFSEVQNILFLRTASSFTGYKWNSNI